MAHPENRQAITDLLACLEAADGNGPLDRVRVRKALHDSRHLLVRFLIMAVRGEANYQLVDLRDELAA